MELDTYSTGQAGKNNRHVRPPNCYLSNTGERDAEERPTSRAYLLNTLENEYGEPSACPSRKSLPCRFNPVHLENSGVLKRGSVYQSSKEVRKLISQREVRRKPELAVSDESFLSFEIVRRPSGHCKSVQKRRNSSHHFTSFDKNPLDFSFRLLPDEQSKCNGQRSDVLLATQCSSDKFLDISLVPEIPEVDEDLNERKLGSNDGVSCSGNLSSSAYILPKSYSAKSSPFHAETDLTSTGQKNRLPLVRKTWDPMKKSKSQRNPSLSCTTRSKEDSLSQKPPASCLSLSIDHQRKPAGPDQLSPIADLVAHLHGTFVLETKQSSSPSFEFSLRDMEESLYCKTWRAKDALNWNYTFQCSKKNSGSGWSSKDRRRQSFPLIGQMHASCYLSSQLNADGLTDKFAVAEFILRDISHLKSYLSPDLGSCKDVTFKDPNLLLDPETRRNPSRVAAADSRAEEWHPQLEIAAIVVRLPFERKRSLRQKLRLEACNDDPLKSRHVSLKVVTSSGRHGLPFTEDSAPSSLLDRWRSGGACDCGGWDMACPITILDNNSVDESSTIFNGNQLSLKLFVQGSKDKTPALSITCGNEDGKYSVYFHGQFSKLQAFAICVAVIHSQEVFGLLNPERNEQRLHSSSLNLVLAEEVRRLLDDVAKGEESKVSDKSPVPFFLDPPFSPIGRV